VGEKLKQEFRLKMGQGSRGPWPRRGSRFFLKDAYDHPKFYRGHDEATGYRTKSIDNGSRLQGRRAHHHGRCPGDQPARRQILRCGRPRLFIALSGMAAIAIENAKMHASLMERQRFVKDMEFARTVQESFLPQGPPVVAGISFSTHYTPAQEVGGDFYDFIQLDSDRPRDRYRRCLGKGVRQHCSWPNWERPSDPALCERDPGRRARK